MNALKQHGGSSIIEGSSRCGGSEGGDKMWGTAHVQLKRGKPSGSVHRVHKVETYMG